MPSQEVPSTFAIPAEYRDKLEFVGSRDPRTDDEILASLGEHVPVTSEKNIWCFWHAGIASMPGWSRRNVVGWVRMCGPDGWTIRVMDNVAESPNYALRWLPADSLPETMVKRTHDGPHVGQHSADFVRGALLYRFGGVWLDVGCLLLRHVERCGWSELEDENSPYRIVVPLSHDQTTLNFYYAARKGDPFIRRWHELFVHLWEGRHNQDGILSNPLLDFMSKTDMADGDGNGVVFGWQAPPKALFEYFAQLAAWERLCMLEPPEHAEDQFNSSEYWTKHVLCADVIPECWPLGQHVGLSSAEEYALLAGRRGQAFVGTSEHAAAEKMVWDALSDASLHKISRGARLAKSPLLGGMLDQPANALVDCAPGTYWELLRYGAVNFRQTRPGITTRAAMKAAEIMKKGHLEA